MVISIFSFFSAGFLDRWERDKEIHLFCVVHSVRGKLLNIESE